MTSSNVELLNRHYRDPRGVIVHVTGYDRVNQRVIFMRDGWPDECFRPLKDFQDNFVRVDE
ncbi:DUF4222 domain-containing protein [Rouxiella badensis]|uniref:DUF4222 domain-containing protein n=1 Tax=Rouxiella badensis TaxID=1646377 RepID=UPI0013EF252D|nr:DUF4222 domain-containing protein [Rouxiella badensis]QII37490.1 DUF4222 domain-containing protein [Rouxiella badensis]